MKTLFLYVMAVWSVCGIARAQDASSKLDAYMEQGTPARGISIPYYDDEGNLQAMFYFDSLKQNTGGILDVTNLRIDAYKDKKVFMTVFSPHCFGKREEVAGQKILSVYSEGDVLIDLTEMTICGRGFSFSTEQNRFEILHDSKVLLKKSARDVKGVEL